MELKRNFSLPHTYDISFLLIVPYGIETSDILSTCRDVELLIVPYGIETFYIPVFKGFLFTF